MIIKWLKIPETQGLKNLDDPSTTLTYAKVIQSKPFLKNVYLDFYQIFKDSIADNKQPNPLLVELGSGGGFLKEVIPNVITTDIIDLPHIDKRFSVLDMPFRDNTVDAFFLIDVLHHIPDVRLFLKEVARCLKPGGKLVMIEPANTFFSRLIYKFFHQEPFDPKAGWELDTNGPLSSANIAIPWIVFQRDRAIFEQEFPNLKISELYQHTPFRYLISGGVTVRQLLPNFTYRYVKLFERILQPFNNYLGMFMTIVLERK